MQYSILGIFPFFCIANNETPLIYKNYQKEDAGIAQFGNDKARIRNRQY